VPAPDLPEALEIPARGRVEGVVRVPGSKSTTNRALLAAALAEGESELAGGLASVDTVVMRRALVAMGASIDDAGEPWRVGGTAGRPRAPREVVHVENSGTSARFLTAALTLAEGPSRLDGNARMRERSIEDLTDALARLGADVAVEGREGCPPVRIGGGGLPGGEATIDGSRSSQYVSGVLLAAPYAGRDVRLRFVDDVLVSRPYVDLTLGVMRDFGAEADWDHGATLGLRVRAGVPYRARHYAIEPDASSAVYPLCAAAIAGGRVEVAGLSAESPQADVRILDLLERMGCAVERRADSVAVARGETGLQSLGEVDMNDCPDAALAYAVVALFADGPTTIRNVWNLRIKETNRLEALRNELSRLGAGVAIGPDWIRVEPAPLHGAAIETYDDHRIAMSFALAGLRVPGVVIRDPGCVTKTWPDFFDWLRRL